MNFKEVTDALFERIDHAELADALGVSVASIRQARLREDAKAHRTAPDGWEKAVLRLAERQIVHFNRLTVSLRKAAEAKGRDKSAKA
jgi:hypothetical protein